MKVAVRLLGGTMVRAEALASDLRRRAREAVAARLADRSRPPAQTKTPGER
ncbi:hypothetical protein [Hyphomicrobium sp.]|uniref:hypothetical protein n=1 Tax=Hyphomicrobium sp. TaxID=82 RepID=UPI002E324022|nr:hypothetical protein [Hyphomicrobium sp.]HEX2843317.1 hypothetical protein [Hyphomicrobium sp.]